MENRLRGAFCASDWSQAWLLRSLPARTPAPNQLVDSCMLTHLRFISGLLPGSSTNLCCTVCFPFVAINNKLTVQTDCFIYQRDIFHMSLWETARRQCCVRRGKDNGHVKPAESAGVNQTISSLQSDGFILTASRREIISAGQNKPGPISVVGGARG